MFGEGKTRKVFAQAPPVFRTKVGSLDLFPKGLMLAAAALRIPCHLGKIWRDLAMVSIGGSAGETRRILGVEIHARQVPRTFTVSSINSIENHNERRAETLRANEADRERDGKQLNNAAQWGPILGQALAPLIWGYFIASECCGAKRPHKGRLSGLRPLICRDNHTGH